VAFKNGAGAVELGLENARLNLMESQRRCSGRENPKLRLGQEINLFLQKLKLHCYSKHSTLPFSLSNVVITHIRCSKMTQEGGNSLGLFFKILILFIVSSNAIILYCSMVHQ
jgi:hypothetical protein